MPTIDVEDVSVYYELYGKGQPLVLIAGYCCDHTFYSFILDELTQHFQVLIFDNCGVGQTKDSNKTLNLELMAQTTILLVRSLGLNQPHILGQSMGGAVAQIIARDYTREINKLIILNSAAKFSLRSILASESLLNLRKNNVPLSLLIDTSLPWFFSDDFLSVPQNISFFKEALINNPFPQSIQDQERQLMALKNFDARTWVNRLNIETLIVAAEQDIIVSPEESRELAQSIAKSQFVLIPGGHSSPLEQPQIVSKHIIEFLGA